MILPVHLANLLFLGLCASATCFVTWNRAVFLLGPVKTSVYIYATPVITIVSSALILHETMTPIMWLGTVLALGGLILSEHREKEKTTAWVVVFCLQQNFFAKNEKSI